MMKSKIISEGTKKKRKLILVWLMLLKIEVKLNQIIKIILIHIINNDLFRTKINMDQS